MDVNSRDNAYKGWEVWLQQVQMTGKMFMGVAALCLALQAIVFAVAVSVLVPDLALSLAWKMQFAKLARGMFMDPTIYVEGQPFPASAILESKAAYRMVSEAMPRFYLAGFVSLSAYLAYLPLLGVFKRKAGKITEVKHIRGMQLIPEKELAASVRKEKGKLPFGSVILPEKYELEHAMIAGMTGQGKSVVIKQQLAAIRAAKLPAVVFDFKGEYVETFYRPGIDHIANPLDERGMRWNIFDDIHSIPDISAITGSLIPPANGDDRFWSAAAQDVLRGVIAALLAQGKRTHEDLWRALTSPVADIAELCASVPQGASGHAYIQDASGKQAASVIAVLMSYVSWLEFAQNGSGFSIKKWLENPGDSFIFLTGRPEVENTLKPYTSLLVDLIGKRFLSMPDDSSRRIYFMLDEFGNMQKLPTVKRLLTAGRSKGASVTLGFQDFAAIVKIYQREDAETILNCTGTSLVLRLSDEPTAKVFSGRFGERQYWDTTETFTMGTADSKDGISLVRNKVTEKLILPSEIQSLPKRVGYLMIPEHEPAKIELKITAANNLPVVNPAFIPSDRISLDELEARDEQLKRVKDMVIGIAGTSTQEAPRVLEDETPEAEGEPEEKPQKKERILLEDLDF